MIRKTWLKVTKIKDVDAYFYVDDVKKDLSFQDDNIAVSSKGYMLGYNDLKDKSVRKLYRFMAKFGDKHMGMKIIRVDFKK